jgi:hypothetical protein
MCITTYLAMHSLVRKLGLELYFLRSFVIDLAKHSALPAICYLNPLLGLICGLSFESDFESAS